MIPLVSSLLILASTGTTPTDACAERRAQAVRLDRAGDLLAASRAYIAAHTTCTGHKARSGAALGATGVLERAHRGGVHTREMVCATLDMIDRHTADAPADEAPLWRKKRQQVEPMRRDSDPPCDPAGEPATLAPAALSPTDARSDGRPLQRPPEDVVPRPPAEPTAGAVQPSPRPAEPAADATRPSPRPAADVPTKRRGAVSSAPRVLGALSLALSSVPLAFMVKGIVESRETGQGRRTLELTPSDDERLEHTLEQYRYSVNTLAVSAAINAAIVAAVGIGLLVVDARQRRAQRAARAHLGACRGGVCLAF